MTTEEALAFLRLHQPLPATRHIDEVLLKKFNEVCVHFSKHPDARCVPLLLNAFGEGDGHGVYQLVIDAIRVHPEELVVENLLAGLRSSHSSVREWNAEIAARYPRPEFVEPLSNLLRDGTIEERLAAIMALSLNKSSAAPSVLRDALRQPIENEAKEAIRKSISL